MKKLLFLMWAAVMVVACNSRQGSFMSEDLQVRVPVKGELAAAMPDTFHLTLGSPMYLFGEVDQQTVDVVVTLFDSASNFIGRFDGPARGPEIFYFRTEYPGDYVLEVAPFKEETGRYIMNLRVAESLAIDPRRQADQLLIPFTGDSVPGASVGVMRDGRLIFSRVCGMADLSYGVPFTVETPCNIGSVSKQFTAYAILMLEQQGKLSIDDDVRTYIPELPDLGKVVRLRNLLNHTNGYREVYNLLPMTGWTGEDQLRREDVIEMLQRQKQLEAPPGEVFSYCNSGYILLADIVERVTGEKFPDWMEENVFQPLGMSGTMIRSDPRTIIPGAAQGYSLDSTGYKIAGDLYASYGASAIYTTVEDLNRWLENFNIPHLGGPDLVTRLVTPDTLNNGDTMSYAKGIALGEFRGLKTYSHNGADIAHRAMLVYFPEIDAGVATLSNFAGFPATAIAYDLAELFFKDDLEPEKEEKATASGTDSVHVKVPERLLEAYAGRYRFEGIGLVATYSLEEGKLMAKAEGQPTLELIPSSDSVFTYKGVDANLTFHLDANGKVTGATHNQGGGSFHLVPVEPFEPGPKALSEFAGTYLCNELETIYTLVVEDSTLVVKIINTDDIKLHPMEEDAFTSEVFYLNELKFSRDPRGRVTGFEASNGRAKGIRFERI